MSVPGSLTPSAPRSSVAYSLPSNAQRPAPDASPLCTLANPSSEEEAAWRSLAVEVYTGQPDADPAAYRRIYESGQLPRKKVWETTQVAYGLRALGFLEGDSVGLGVGCGVEPLLYFLACHTARLYATDLYGFGWVTAPLEMLHDPARYAPYDYPRDRLTVLQMNGLGLVMPDASVDFVYSISTIEHFGGPRYALAHAREAARILKPGGVLAFSTEYVLQEGAQGLSPNARDFFNRTMLDWLILNSGLERIGPLDLTPAPELLDDPGVILLPEWTLAQAHFDRLSVRLDDTLFTDVVLFLRKPV
ncbi:MAG TPA: class I SAM-dependent methyltransferase [Chthonomonadaceae bacterium]|nr:class I SAM-dependent methyltransferase [Chthonomonadaceae bacterium]